VTAPSATLRRADWRYLLPEPPAGRFRHVLLLGGPPGLAGMLVEAGTADRVSTALPPDGPVDALVVLSDAHVPPRDAAAHLASDALLYWEIDRRHWRGPLRTRRWIARQLRLLGLRPLGLYWVIPDFDDARRFLPLDRPASLQWFFATRFVASTPARAALDRAVRAASRGQGHALSNLVPCCAVIAGSPARGLSPPAALAAPELEPRLRRPDVRVALFTSGQDDGSRVVILPFASDRREPERVIKLARRPDFDGHTAREQATLRLPRSTASSDLLQSLPEPLGAHGTGLARGFQESFIPGRMLAASTGRWRAPMADQLDDLRLAAEWLAAFHEATMLGRPMWDREQIERWIEQPLRQYAEAFGEAPDESRLFAAMRARAAALTGERLPLVWTHNDYNPWHVYRSGATLGVIDWEFGDEDVTRRQGLPLCDLVYFVNHWIGLASGRAGEAAELRGFRDVFLVRPPRDPRCTAAQGALDAYVDRLALHPAFLSLLVAQTWIERAVDRDRRLRALGPAPGEGAGDNRFVRNVRSLARGVAELFGEGRGELTPGSMASRG
jgi:hypothetical protein